MKFKVKNELIKKEGKAKVRNGFLINFMEDRDLNDYFEWYSDLEVDLLRLTESEMKKFIKLFERHIDIRGSKTGIRDIKAWIDLKNDKLKTVKRVKDFDSYLTQYLNTINGHRIYAHDKFDPDAILCYRVTSIDYHVKETHNYSTTPEHVTVTLVYKRFGIEYEQTLTFWRKDIITYTPPQALIEFGFEPETKELRDQYLADTKRYTSVHSQIGKQYIANGGGLDDTLDDEEDDHRRYRHIKKGKSYKFVNSQVLIDSFLEDEAAYEELSHETHVDDGAWWWSRIGGKVKEDEDEDDGDELEYPPEEVNVEIPIHPHVVVFDLLRHVRLTTHINFLKEYEYDENLADKLIIDPNVKRLIEVLINTDSDFKDIVKNKSGGKVMLLAGAAGVGKTLTAEVFAEYQKKPLYNVQASQLGLNPEELETELKRVLTRAAKWDAILLIDEADVYVHKRENNLIQNAIVGVFLRVLEYHDATIFLTTNLPDIVDDAIISRCVAKIVYQYPSKEQQIKIWCVISKLSNIKIDQDVIEEFVEKHNNYSGRDIKNILKLANLKSKADNDAIDIEMLEFISQFNPAVTRNEKN